jgi:F0F1-type ATP synthase epsilon subunit
MDNNNNNNTDPYKIHLLVRNRDKIFFDEDVKAITSVNDTGLFDILPQHSNFISIIHDYIVIHKLEGTKQRININNGVLKVKDNLINCYINIIPAKSIIPELPLQIPSTK